MAIPSKDELVLALLNSNTTDAQILKVLIHDLYNPVTSIQGAVHWLREKDPEMDEEKLLETIENLAAGLKTFLQAHVEYQQIQDGLRPDPRNQLSATNDPL